MKFGLPERVVQAMVKELQRRETVSRAVIFGSRARGDYKYNSDIDIAVYCEGSFPPGLRSDLDEAAGIYKIDVVDMNGPVAEKLRQKIEEQGIEIYRRNE
ncbi:DNA polymerase, beta domain protein region [Thermosinus carboxydivorans Nor1]|uniref:DNA polymerase, beta domain protein region n=1 Tax=Thermosinus carboxydivorans Nor1 TaxID=401526 RepID=A1HM72_9FIRM|nr:nucleotidyltransferase domain-containing protein [Thermosinus carboxydivorans]EAX48920.1 DNA polymerase, beta domain protein region [Thermosinus carboxydivorans Nor1]